jgi:hypothetical protein
VARERYILIDLALLIMPSRIKAASAWKISA